MGYNLQGKFVLAAIPVKQRKYSCYLCGHKEKLGPMVKHLQDDHGKEVELGGYVITEREDK